jgi:hypothetical protein
MASKHLTSVPLNALASILLALAIGSMPVATLIALNAHMGAIK